MNWVEERIKNNYSRLTKKQRSISKFIIENMEEMAFYPLSKLSQKTKVSEASVTRFCFALGYEGYADFQKDIQAWIKSRITPLIKIKKSIAQVQDKNIYLKVINADIANLESLREKFPKSQLQHAVDFITNAEKVYIIGMRTSYAIAVLLDHYLNHIGILSDLLNSEGGRLLDKVIHIGKKDVLVGICFPRYFKQTVEVLRYARSKSCKTIVMTDSVLSPAAQEADVVITAKYQTPIPFHSYVSVGSLINCLIYGIIMKRKKQSVDFLADIENMLKSWKVIIDT